MSDYICDECIHNKGTVRSTYTDDYGHRREIAIEFVRCEKRWTRRKIRDDGTARLCLCLDYERGRKCSG